VLRLITRNDALIRSSTKSAADPARNGRRGASRRLDTPRHPGHRTTMRNLDQGVGIIGLLALASALALLPTIGIPIAVSKEAVELKDWLGFAGNVLGAFVALLAAVIAWRAVQRQITVQREANLLDILTREEDRLEQELFAIEVCISYHLVALKAFYSPGYATYVQALCSRGISPEIIEMRRSIQERAGGASSLRVVIRSSEILANLIRRATEVRNMTQNVDLDAFRKNVPGVAAPSGLRQALNDLGAAEKETTQSYYNLLERSGHISERLLPQYRKKIEAGLWQIH
jgi:hypothetical protein